MRWLFIAEWAVRLVMFVVVVSRKRAAPTALAWLAVVAFLPFIGALAYFMFGEIRLGRRRSGEYQRLVDTMSESSELRRQFAAYGSVALRDSHRIIHHLAVGVGAREPRPGNQLELLADARDLFARLTADIDAAEHHCHLLFYIADHDPDDPVTREVGAALMRASRRGVECRMLLDAAGSRRFLRGELCRELRAAGVAVVEMLPVNPVRALAARIDLRNHRKLVVVDGGVGYMGSHNLTDPVYPGKESFGDWLDASVRIRGPVVYDLQEVFLQDWLFSAGALPRDARFFPAAVAEAGGVAASVLPTAPTTGRSPFLDVIVQTLQLARHRCVLTTPYFVPDDALLTALRAAALRGVEVILVLPKRGDHAWSQAAGRSHFGYLLDAGVEIREYPGALLHSKTLTMDREFAILGSANLDVRSFSLNFELALLVYDTDFASQLHYLQMEYLEPAERITAQDWAQRGRLRGLGDNVARLITPLL
jgi:cardiolipin synthase A/B